LRPGGISVGGEGIPQYDHGVGGGVGAGVDVGQHRVRRVHGEAVRALGPLLDELPGGQVPDDPLWAVEKYNVDGATSCRVRVV